MGLPARLPDVAVSVFVPADVPSVHERSVAMPAPSVGTVVPVAGFVEPPPPVTSNFTPTPATGFPLASRTITDGAVATALPAVALWPLPAFTAICDAPPAPSV